MKTCKCCGREFNPALSAQYPPQQICDDCAAQKLIEDMERDARNNREDDEPPRRGFFGEHVQGFL